MGKLPVPPACGRGGGGGGGGGQRMDEDFKQKSSPGEKTLNPKSKPNLTATTSCSGKDFFLVLQGGVCPNPKSVVPAREQIHFCPIHATSSPTYKLPDQNDLLLNQFHQLAYLVHLQFRQQLSVHVQYVTHTFVEFPFLFSRPIYHYLFDINQNDDNLTQFPTINVSFLFLLVLIRKF